jgi:hypothetical protein
MDDEVDLEYIPRQRLARIVVVRIVEARHGSRHTLGLGRQTSDDVYLIGVSRCHQELRPLDPGLGQKPGTRPVSLYREGVELLRRPLYKPLVLLDEDDVVSFSREHQGRVKTHLSGSHDNYSQRA